MAVYSGNSTQWGVYITLPGERAVYRVSERYQPWRYCIAGLIFANAMPTTEPPSLPC
jgi:hypothetical protein